MEEKGNELIIIAICDGNCPLADATKSYTVDKKIMTPNGLQAQNANHLSLHFFFSKNALDGSRLFQALRTQTFQYTNNAPARRSLQEYKVVARF